MMADGFLSRWSKRKAGKEDDLVEQPKETIQTPAPISTDVQAQPPASLEDVEKIDRFAPDFSSFMKPNVDPTVQQAALKKMFTDPHFNVMDGLDIYIGDYSKPDPLPPGMLERMVQSDMLNLFRKQSEPLPTTEQQAKESMASQDPKQDVLASQDQADLTSSQSVGPDTTPTEPVQKKNTEEDLE
jgi:hypothetical protein